MTACVAAIILRRFDSTRFKAKSFQPLVPYLQYTQVNPEIIIKHDKFKDEPTTIYGSFYYNIREIEPSDRGNNLLDQR